MTAKCSICGREFEAQGTHMDCPGCGVIVECRGMTMPEVDAEAKSNIGLFGDPLAVFLFELLRFVPNGTIADALERTKGLWRVSGGRAQNDTGWLVQHCRAMARVLRMLEKNGGTE